MTNEAANVFHVILDNGEELELTPADADRLIKQSAIYRCDECEALDDAPEPRTEQRIYHINTDLQEDWDNHSGAFADLPTEGRT